MAYALRPDGKARWRSPFGATEGRNLHWWLAILTIGLWWRSPSGATEDRNSARPASSSR
ncbi:hypothetical protein [Nonomuraea sp. NPDC050691]|uniref:hypothetical protein n=1 Tax=Nonomuraea sp. NPDC050691 TaxID=3155661 RepID=UPI0033E3CA35